MPRSTSAAADPISHDCGIVEPGCTLPTLADVVNCTSVHAPGLVGGTRFGVGHDDGDGAGAMVVGANGFADGVAVFRSTRYGRNRLALTTACGPCGVS